MFTTLPALQENHSSCHFAARKLSKQQRSVLNIHELPEDLAASPSYAVRSTGPFVVRALISVHCGSCVNFLTMVKNYYVYATCIDASSRWNMLRTWLNTLSSLFLAIQFSQILFGLQMIS